ncbi:ABC transporter substrate-binding protein [Mucisphaera sp.]|uniref:ABC transporter substrate-binding protein n=1 Tax=Mucisphaera sp. TaxID=2913024 RepID=UPI003D13A5D7
MSPARGRRRGRKVLRVWLIGAAIVMAGWASPGFAEQRVVSLAPALSRMIVDLGAADRLVGVSEYDTATEGLPVVGSMAAIDRERLIAVRPTLVLHMGLMAASGQRLPALARRSGFALHGFRYPNRVGEVWDLLAVDPTETDGAEAGITVGSLLSLEAEARALRASLEARLEEVRALVADRERPAALLVIGVEPVAASGPGTVLDEMLALAGGRNALGEAGGTYQTLDHELLRAVSPEVVFLLLPGAPVFTEDDRRLVPWARAETAAWRDERVYLIRDPEVLLPSTGLVDVVEEMAGLLHPGVFEDEGGSAGVDDE